MSFTYFFCLFSDIPEVEIGPQKRSCPPTFVCYFQTIYIFNVDFVFCTYREVYEAAHWSHMYFSELVGVFGSFNTSCSFPLRKRGRFLYTIRGAKGKVQLSFHKKRSQALPYVWRKFHNPLFRPPPPYAPTLTLSPPWNLLILNLLTYWRTPESL